MLWSLSQIYQKTSLHLNLGEQDLCVNHLSHSASNGLILGICEGSHFRFPLKRQSHLIIPVWMSFSVCRLRPTETFPWSLWTMTWNNAWRDSRYLKCKGCTWFMCYISFWWNNIIPLSCKICGERNERLRTISRHSVNLNSFHYVLF